MSNSMSFMRIKLFSNFLFFFFLSLLLSGFSPERHYFILDQKAATAMNKKAPEELINDYLEMVEVQKEFPFSEWSTQLRLLFHSVEITLNDHFDLLLKKAHLFYVAHEYGEALPLYEEVERALNRGCYPKANTKEHLLKKKVQLALAKTLYKLSDYNKLLTLAGSKENIEDRIDCELLYLVAKAHKKALDYHNAISLFEHYVAHANKSEEGDYLQALYELGTLYHKNGNNSAAKIHLEKIIKRGLKKNTMTLFAMTLLAEIHLEEKNLPKAKEYLSIAMKSTFKNDALVERFALLQGNILLHSKEYIKALPHFERALSLSSRHKESIALTLAYCHLSAKNEAGDLQAEKLFTYLLTTKKKSPALLGIAYLHMTKKREALALSLLTQHYDSLSLEEQLLAHLLMAKIEATEEHLLAATAIKYAHCPEYSYSWFCKGLSELKKRELSQAIDSLETAVTLTKHSTQNSLQESFIYQLYEKDLLPFLQREGDREAPLLYTKALIYTYFEQGEAAKALFEKVIAKEALYQDRAFYRLASLYYQERNFAKAKEYFLTLSQRHPASDLAAAGWYWAAESEEQLHPTSSNTIIYRQQLLEEYPKSFLGAEAYFKLFTIDSYIAGEEHSLTHLRNFPELFPDSTLNVAIYYLLSFHQKSKEKSLDVLEKALTFFATLPSENQTKGVLYFRTKAILRMAKLYSHGEADKAIFLLKPLLQEFEDPKREIGSKEAHALSFLVEECQFILAKSYIANKKLYKGQKLLLGILEANAKSAIHEGYLLALTWQEQGDLAFAAGEMATALSNYELALKSGEKYLTLSQKRYLESSIRKSSEASSSSALPEKGAHIDSSKLLYQ